MNRKDIIIYAIEYTFGLVISIIFGVITPNFAYIYSYLFATLFIVLTILGISHFDKKIIDLFIDPEKRGKKRIFIMSWISKFFPLFSLLIFCIAISFFTINFQIFSFIVPTIILTTVIFTSEFLKFNKIRKFSSNILNF